MNKNRNKIAAMMMVAAITFSSVSMPVEAADKNVNKGRVQRENRVVEQTGEIRLDKDTFPDDGFRERLSEIIGVKENQTIPNDVLNISTLDFGDNFDNKKINNMIGIQNFKNLKILKIYECNSLESVDLSLNTNLEDIMILDSSLEKIDLTKNINAKNINLNNRYGKGKISELLLPNVSPKEEKILESIELSGNNLNGKLDLSKFKGLLNVVVSHNNIFEIILPENNNIGTLNCSNLKNITEIDLSTSNNLVNLNISDTRISQLNLKDKKKLVYLEADRCELKKVDLENCEKLKKIDLTQNNISYFNIKGCSSIEELDIRENKISTLDISENKNIYYIIVEKNPLGYVKGNESVSIWNSNEEYIYLDIEDNSKSIDLNYYFPGIEMDKLKIKNAGITKNGTKLEWKGDMPTVIRYDYIVGGKNNNEILEVYITLSPYGGGPCGGSGSTTPDNKPDTNPNKPIEIRGKIVGKNRYETAAKIADQMGSYNTVILVNSDKSMADGLSAASLSGKKNAPILLVKKNSIPSETMARLEKAENVYIIGGNNVISKKVENQLKGKKITRISGKDRYDTSAKIANLLGDYDTAFIVNGAKGEADAMSVSSVAAKYGAPILLTNGKTSKHLKKANVRYFVIGGKAVVSRALEDRYDADRISGVDRYSTNRKIIDEFYYDSKKVYFAKGDTLVDALAVSALAKEDGVVLVSKKANHKKLEGKKAIQVGGMDFEIDVK